MAVFNNSAILGNADQGVNAPVPLVMVGVSNVSFTNTAGVTNSLTIPADYLTVGSKYEVRLTGSVIKTTLLSTNLNVALRLNGSSILTTTVALGTTTFASPGRGFISLGSFTVRATGASGSLYPELGTSVNAIADVDSNNVAMSTINTTVSNSFDLTCVGSDAGTTGTIRSYHILQIK